MTAQETFSPFNIPSEIGDQDSCKAFRNLVKSNLVTESMSKKWNCLDKAVAESFF